MNRQPSSSRCVDDLTEKPNSGSYLEDEREKIEMFFQSYMGARETPFIVNISISVEGIEGHPKELIDVQFEELSLQVRVKKLNNRNLFFSVPHLFRPIVVKDCKFCIGKDKIILALRKADPCIWESIFYSHPSFISEFKEELLAILTPLAKKIPHSRCLILPSEALFRLCGFDVGSIKNLYLEYARVALRDFVVRIQTLALVIHLVYGNHRVAATVTDLREGHKNISEAHYQNYYDFRIFMQTANITLPLDLRSAEEVVDFLKTDLPNRGHNVDEYVLLLALALYEKVKLNFSKTHPEAVRTTAEPKTKLKRDDGSASEEKRKAENFKEVGNGHFRAKRFRDAVDAYTKAIALDPLCPVYYLKRAITLFQLSEFHESLKDLNSTLKIDPFSVKAFLYKAKIISIFGDIEDAKDNLYWAKRLDPNNKIVDDELARFEKLENPAEMFAEAIKSGGLSFSDRMARLSEFLNNFLPSVENLIKALISRGLLTDAKLMGVIITRVYQGNEKIKNIGFHLLGLCALSEDDEEGVHDNYGKCLAFPIARKIYTEIKEVYVFIRRGDEALAANLFEEAADSYMKSLQRCRNIDPPLSHLTRNISSKLYYKTAKAKMHLDKRLEAKSFVNSAIDLKKDYHEALALRGELFQKNENYSEARKDLEKAIIIFPCNRYRELLQRWEPNWNSSSLQESNSETPNSKSVDPTEEALQKSLANCKKEKGNERFKDGRFHESIEAYSEAIALDSRNPIYYSNRSACHLALKNFTDAKKDAEEALKIDPSILKAWLRLSKSQIALGQAEEAVHSLEKALKLHTKVTDLKREMERAKSLKDAIASGNSCLMSGDYLNAECHFSAAVKLGEACVGLHLKEIECLYHLGKYEKVISVVESAFNLDAENSTLYYFKGLCCYQEGERNEAIRLLEKSLSIDPTQAKVCETLKRIKNVFQLKDLGNRAFSENRLQDALSHYSEGLREDSTNKSLNAVFHFNIGVVHRRKDCMNEAVDSFSFAISLKTDYVKAYLKRAECYSKLGKLTEAVEDYEALMKLSPSPEHEKLLRTAKDAVETKSFADLSERDLEIALAECKKKKGDKYFSDKKYKEAFKTFSEAISLNPGCPAYYVSCCDCYVTMGKRLDFGKKSEESIDYVEGYIRVGKCYVALGNPEEAVAAFEKAKEFDPKNEEIVEEIVNSLRLGKFLQKGEEALKAKWFSIACEHFESASKIARLDTSLLLKRAECLFHLRETKELKDLIGSVSDELKEYSDILCMKGIFSYLEDNRQEALGYLKSAFDTEPLSKKAKDWTTQIQTVYDIKEKGKKVFLKQDYTKALECYKEALTHEPGCSLVQSKLHFNIGVLQMKEKSFGEAIESFSRAINIKKDYVKALERRAACYREISNAEGAVQDYRKLYNLTSSEAYLKMLQKAQELLQSTSSRDYYEILAVSRDASMEEIRKSFKRLALEFHPDRMITEGDKAVGEEKFKEISKAYSVLIDPLKRERYDRGEKEEDQRFSYGPFGGIHPFMFHPFYADPFFLFGYPFEPENDESPY